MKRLFIGLALAAAVLCGCQKINDLESRMKVAETDISSLKSDVASLRAAVENHYSISAIQQTSDGYILTLSNGSSITLNNGDSFFESVVASDGVVVITLKDGSVYRLPLAEDYPLKAVKSLTYIPEYMDGYATVNYFKPEDATVVLKYMITPTNAAVTLMKAVEAGTLKVVPLAAHPATRSLADELTKLEAKLFEIEADGLLKVTVDASGLSADFFAGKCGAAVATTFTDGVSEVASAFVPLNKECSGLDYAGVTYHIKKMADGKVWMTDNLRYIPEGLVPSSDLENVTAGIYMPVVWADGKPAFGTDEDVERQGYLYQSEVALGLSVGSIRNENAAKELEGTRGICPEGWHIPTLSDYLGLVGKSVGASTVTTAPYFDGNNGSMQMLNADGFNLFPCGAVTIQDNTKTVATLMGKLGKYEYISSGYICGSSYAGVTYSNNRMTNVQFFGLMPMSNKDSEAEYTANGSKLSYRIAASVRCVKD